MKKDDLKIEIIPLYRTDRISLKSGLRPPLSINSKFRKDKKFKSNNSEDLYEARHMFHTKLGKIIVAYETGPSPLQAKKRLIRLLL